MKFKLFYQFEFEYIYKAKSIAFSEKESTSSQNYFEMRGRIFGDIEGSFRGVNHPVRRSDDVFLSNAQGVIETTDGATIYVDLKGYGPRVNEANVYRSYMGPIRHITEDSRYTRLNAIWCFGEGEVGAVGNTAEAETSGITKINVYELIWERLNRE